MKVIAEQHYGAVVLINEDNETMLVQSEADQNEILPKDWSSGDWIEISDEYEEFFE